MNTDKFFQVLSAIHPLSDDFKKAIEKELILLSFPKNHLLLEPPRIAEHAYFLEEGFAMSYTFVTGKKQIDEFWTSGQIMVSARSFFEQVPSREYIQLMDKSEVFCISHSSVLTLFSQYPEAHFIYRVIMNRYYEHSRERIRDMQHLTTAERFEKLLQAFPTVEQFVTQEQIASYLGITPQSLSRIKRRKGRS